MSNSMNSLIKSLSKYFNRVSWLNIDNIRWLIDNNIEGYNVLHMQGGESTHELYRIQSDLYYIKFGYYPKCFDDIDFFNDILEIGRFNDISEIGKIIDHKLFNYTLKQI